jgi:hypothetical protein
MPKHLANKEKYFNILILPAVSENYFVKSLYLQALCVLLITFLW